jgi:CubicO group peptidase (beta-lactamase class C family)
MSLASSRLRALALALLLAPLALPGTRPALAQTTARASAPARTATAAPKIDWAALDAYVNKAIADWQVPGLALAIVRNDSVIYAKGYGVKTLGKSDPVTDRTLFAMASTSKAFTAALMGMLVDSGKVKWDDPVTKYLPWFQMYDPYVTRELTVRDVLSHRSGLARGDMLWYASPRAGEDVIRQVRYLAPAWSVRSHFGYQNIMFMTAAEVEHAVTGKTWDDLVRQRILAPLGMTSTLTYVHDVEGKPDVATPHEKIDDRVEPIHWRPVDNLTGAGALISNVRDYAQWVRLQLGNGVYEGKRFLSPAVMREMHSPQTIIGITERQEKLNPEIHFSAYGLGWFLIDYRGRKIIHHGGNLDGFSAEVNLMPEENLGMVILTNMDGTALRDALPFQIYDMFLGGKKTDWSARYLEVKRENEQKADSVKRKREADHVQGTHPSLALDRYAGTYTDSLYGDLRVSFENGHLVATTNPSFVGDLEHWHYDTFRINWRDRSLGKGWVSFRLGEDGKVAAASVEDLGEFRRVKDAEGRTAGGSH